MFGIRLAAVGGLTLLLCACASFPQQPYNRQANVGVKQIAIVTPAISPKTNAWLAVHPAQSFGLVGGLVAVADTTSKTDRLTEVVQGAGFDQTAFFIEAVQQELKALGYETKVVTIERDAEKFDFLPEYPAIQGSQAILDMYAGSYGFMAAGASTPYRPTFYLAARLASAESGNTVLFADQFLYNPFGQPKDSVTINATTEYDVDSFDDLVSAPPRVVAGLKTAAKSVAAELARQLQ